MIAMGSVRAQSHDQRLSVTDHCLINTGSVHDEPCDQCLISPDDIYFDPADRAIITRCTKCQAVIQLRLGGIGDAPTAKRAVIILSERPGMCPPLASGGFAPWAHPELGFYSYWQIGQ